MKNLFFLCLLMSYPLMAGQQNNHYPGAVAVWHLNENTGTAISDSKLNVWKGTATSVAWVTGKYGSACSFGGSAYILVPFGVANYSNISICEWIKMGTGNVNAGLALGCFSSANGKGFGAFWHNTEGAAWQGGDGASWPAAFNVNIPLASLPVGKWSFLTLVAGVGNAACYVNGVFVSGKGATAISPWTGANAIVGIGAYGDGSASSFTGYFKGSIDDIGIYNAVLSTGQIVNLYKSMKAKYE